jgi:hypothetical protein
MMERLLDIEIVADNYIFGFFFYYFIGMVISRTGSLLERPLRFGLKIQSKESYVKAEQKDPKIQTLLQDANTYRTIAALGLLCFVGLIANQFIYRPIEDPAVFWLLITFVTLIAALFVFSYRKQNNHIISRVNAAKGGK